MLKPLVLLGLIAIACSPAAPATNTGAPATGATSEPKRATNQVLRVAQTGIPPSLSPEISSSNIAYFSALMDTITDLSPDFSIKPQVAERWEYNGTS